MAIGKGTRITWDGIAGTVTEIVTTPGSRPTARIELADGRRLLVLVQELPEEQATAEALTQKPPRLRHKMVVGPDRTKQEPPDAPA